ncbi:hypothetical protein EDEG_00230 [Edhazardia aedis USNM 41457]|uniref:Uncharacterized protein n=1 Tax=Edhazardia aedis (strain USNM 41457) TaxID=1003232 RepID=J9DKY1_EDHAE|nr:hypothetical protein EDEG_00230 [Edhazardia aedis USNM 41457]|eukprot:EJW03250.1 hypothetical protein EDEG_00230 [Edhazardia aedis USNM 41457]
MNMNTNTGKTDENNEKKDANQKESKNNENKEDVNKKGEKTNTRDIKQVIMSEKNAKDVHNSKDSEVEVSEKMKKSSDVLNRNVEEKINSVDSDISKSKATQKKAIKFDAVKDVESTQSEPSLSFNNNQNTIFSPAKTASDTCKSPFLSSMPNTKNKESPFLISFPKNTDEIGTAQQPVTFVHTGSGFESTENKDEDILNDVKSYKNIYSGNCTLYRFDISSGDIHSRGTGKIFISLVEDKNLYRVMMIKEK